MRFLNAAKLNAFFSGHALADSLKDKPRFPERPKNRRSDNGLRAFGDFMVGAIKVQGGPVALHCCLLMVASPQVLRQRTESDPRRCEV